MLVIKNLSLYMIKDLRVLLKDFSFSLSPGQKVALIGEEGNGKSTLLKAIYNEDLIFEYVEISGQISKTGEIIGYIPQQINAEDSHFSTRDFLNKQVSLEDFDYALFYSLLDEIEFNEDRISEDIYLYNLSGGEKIKFQLICLLMKNPTLLLLDEPTNDLDLASIKWLEKFILSQSIPIMFVSHDETLLNKCANTIIHIEQIIRKTEPKYTIAGVGYSEYIENRNNLINRQEQLAKKEKDQYDKKMDRYRQIYQKVEHEQNSISRKDPQGGRLLKKKMHSIMSMGHRYEREKENMAKKPDYEDSILVRFGDEISIPNSKKIIELKLDKLIAGDKILSKGIELDVYGATKMCIVGANGSGKTTLIRYILRYLMDSNIKYGYMPQDYFEMMDPKKNPVEFLSKIGSKSELTTIRTYLGSMNFTQEEMFHPVEDLSGGQRAKLYFSKMILDESEVLILDEPTRNMSPLSGPEIRQALKSFKGCIISVSHDRKYIEEVCDEIYRLDKTGLRRILNLVD